MAEELSVIVARLDERLKCAEEDLAHYAVFERDYRKVHNELANVVQLNGNRITSLETRSTLLAATLIVLIPAFIALATFAIAHWESMSK